MNDSLVFVYGDYIGGAKKTLPVIFFKCRRPCPCLIYSRTSKPFVALMTNFLALFNIGDLLDFSSSIRSGSSFWRIIVLATNSGFLGESNFGWFESSSNSYFTPSLPSSFKRESWKAVINFLRWASFYGSGWKSAGFLKFEFITVGPLFSELNFYSSTMELSAFDSETKEDTSLLSFCDSSFNEWTCSFFYSCSFYFYWIGTIFLGEDSLRLTLLFFLSIFS